MQDTRTFHERESRASLKMIGTPVLTTVVDEATGEKVTREASAFVPVWKQSATDDEGRRRFHGAFTGGFSAGYFNSVGSKEGWKPQEFVSSRDARATARQSVEDFMDEEDLAGSVSATRTGLFAPPKKEEVTHSLEHAMSQILERVPDDSNMGLVLMRKLGWRDGTGIGPMVKRRLPPAAVAPVPGAAAEPKKRMVGPALSRDEIDEIRSQPTAPRDVGVVKYVPKDNAHGLGFDAFAAAPEFAAAARAHRTGAAPEKSRRSRDAFGLGAFEDPEDDPFEVDDMARYDNATGGRTASVASVGVNPTDQGTKSHSSKVVCSDNRAPLPGFDLGLVFVETVKHPPVVVPPDYVPTPPFHASFLSAHSAQNFPALAQWALAAAKRAMASMAAASAAAAAVASVSEVKKEEEPPIAVKPPVVSDSFFGDQLKARQYQNWLMEQGGSLVVWGSLARPTAAEVAEFEQERERWKAVPSGMADRFAPSGHVQVKTEEEMKAEEFRKFGRGTTRTEEDWMPTNLLCRRWGVPDPFANGKRPRPDGPVGSAAASVQGDMFPALTRELERQFGASYHAQMQIAEAAAAEAAAKAKLQNPTEHVAPEVRPPQDVFSAIFESQTFSEEPVAHPPLPPPVPRTVIDVDTFIAPAAVVPKRERVEEPSSLLDSIFGSVKKSKTLELLDKTLAVKEFVTGALSEDDKKKKKKKKKKEKKKKDDKKSKKKKEKK